MRLANLPSLMRANSQRLSGVILMIILLTAQTMGWCKAYVCDSTGVTEITLMNHCHTAERGEHAHEHEHGDHREARDQGCECSTHHDHDLMTGAFSVTSPRNDEARSLVDVPLVFVAVLPSPEIEWSMEKAELYRDAAVSTKCRPLSCEMRLTVALLI